MEKTMPIFVRLGSSAAYAPEMTLGWLVTGAADAGGADGPGFSHWLRLVVAPVLVCVGP